ILCPSPAGFAPRRASLAGGPCGAPPVFPAGPRPPLRCGAPLPPRLVQLPRSPVFSVIQLPGSNDDRDLRFALKSVLGCPAELVWHERAELPSDTRAVLIPGGFSYGDYLRAGAMAAYAPVMAAVRRFADAGGPVLGVCNGFQVLCESRLLPGALVRNQDLHFICDFVHVRVERSAAPFTSRAPAGRVLRLPIKHGEGAYFAHPDELARLERDGQIVLRYC